MDSKWKQWHHGYLGFILLLVSALFKDKKVKRILIILGAIILIDEVYQWIVDDQYAGLLHWLYVNTLYKIDFIKDFNILLDKLFGA